MHTLPVRRVGHGKEYPQTPGSKMLNSCWNGVYPLSPPALLMFV